MRTITLHRTNHVLDRSFPLRIFVNDILIGTMLTNDEFSFEIDDTMNSFQITYTSRIETIKSYTIYIGPGEASLNYDVIEYKNYIDVI